MTRITLTAITAALTISLVACGGDSGTTVTREEFGEDWPFTIDEGRINCEGSAGRAAVTFTGEGIGEVALNGFALEDGVAEIPKKYWRLDNELIEIFREPGQSLQDVKRQAGDLPRISIAPLQEAAAEICSDES